MTETRMRSRHFVLQVLFVVFAVLCHVVNSNVIGIDFASDSMKVAIVQPGSLEIVTNFQSKRKTPTCIAFYKGERLFGSDAYALMGRKPESSFAKTFRMLGKDVEHPHIQELSKQHFPYTIYKNETTGLTTLKVDETHYTPEELIAMMLQHVKDMAHAFEGHSVRDCVITVPSSFSQHEREALYTAAEIADLKILSLIEENTAAAVYYGIDRVFETPHTVLYYNMGAGSVQVSLVTYSSYMGKDGGKPKAIGQFEVVGKAWDASLGGFNFDVRLADLLAQRFNAQWGKKASGQGKDVRDFNRPMTRLRLEANKVKEVLSANAEFPIRAEQLHADVDLVTKVTRADFEEACADLFQRLTVPIDEALRMANLTLADVHSVELLGGGVRMPKVKKILDEYLSAGAAASSASSTTTTPPLSAGQHLNGDEAMALGAAFRAANLSTSLRVRKVGMMDVSSFGVSVRLESLPSQEGEKKNGFFSNLFGNNAVGSATGTDSESKEAPTLWSKFTSLYPRKSTYAAKTKTVAFHHHEDIACQLEYDASTQSTTAGNNNNNDNDAVVARYHISGIAQFAQEYAQKAGGAEPKVHLSFALDSSGRVELTKAEATLELPVQASTTTTSTAAGDEDNNNNKTTTSSAESETEAADSTSTSGSNADSETANNNNNNNNSTTTANTTDSNTTSSSSSSSNQGKKKATTNHNIVRRVLTIDAIPTALSPPRWTPSLIAEAKQRLRHLQAIDDARKAKAAAMNDLEAYAYKVKNRLVDEADLLSAVSTEAQRSAIVELADAAEDWLYDAGRTISDVAVFKAKHAELRDLAEAVFQRYAEVSLRSEAVSKAEKSLQDVRRAVSSWSEKLPHITEEEKATLLATVEVAEAWLSAQVDAQAKVSPYEQPVFHSKEVAGHVKPVATLFEKLLKKPKPAPVVVVDKEEGNTKKNATDDAQEEGPEVIKVNVETVGGEEEKEEEEVKKETTKEDL